MTTTDIDDRRKLMSLAERQQLEEAHPIPKALKKQAADVMAAGAFEGCACRTPKECKGVDAHFFCETCAEWRSVCDKSGDVRACKKSGLDCQFYQDGRGCPWMGKKSTPAEPPAEPPAEQCEVEIRDTDEVTGDLTPARETGIRSRAEREFNRAIDPLVLIDRMTDLKVSKKMDADAIKAIPEVIGKLMELQNDEDRKRGMIKLQAAIANVAARCPAIEPDKEVWGNVNKGTKERPKWEKCIRYRYISHPKLMRYLRPLLADEGISLTEHDGGAEPYLRNHTITHPDGKTEETTIMLQQCIVIVSGFGVEKEFKRTMPIDWQGAGDKRYSILQAFAGKSSAARRKTICEIFQITQPDDDLTDGNDNARSGATRSAERRLPR